MSQQAPAVNPGVDNSLGGTILLVLNALLQLIKSFTGGNAGVAGATTQLQPVTPPPWQMQTPGAPSWQLPGAPSWQLPGAPSWQLPAAPTPGWAASLAPNPNWQVPTAPPNWQIQTPPPDLQVPTAPPSWQLPTVPPSWQVPTPPPLQNWQQTPPTLPPGWQKPIVTPQIPPNWQIPQQQIPQNPSSGSGNLIPRRILLGNPEYSQVQTSPDGRWLSYLAPLNGALNVFVRATDSVQPTTGFSVYINNANATPVTNSSRNIRKYDWTYDNRHIIYASDQNGDENFRLYRANVETAQSTPLVDTSGAITQLLSTSVQRPTEIAIGINDRDSSNHDVYLITVATGAKTLVYQNVDQYSAESFFFDNQLQLRLAFKIRTDGGIDFFKRNVMSGQWSPYRSLDVDQVQSRPLRFDATNQRVYWLDNTGEDKLALVSIDIDNANDRRVIYRSTKPADLFTLGALFHRISAQPLFAIECWARMNYVPLDPALQSDVNMIASQLVHPPRPPGEPPLPPITDMVAYESVSNDLQKWIVRFYSGVMPSKFYLYDRPKRTLRFLFDSKPALLPYQQSFVRLSPVLVGTRDGLQEMCYLSLPPASATNPQLYTVTPKPEIPILFYGDIGVPQQPLAPLQLVYTKPNRPLPLVLDVHGGPQAREYWDFNTQAQFITNRGYAYLSCNFRGSTGFGKAFLKAGNGEWGRNMQNDLTDAVNWAVSEGIADARKVAIFGASWGGYATLSGLAFTPDLYTCGVDWFGMSNLQTFVDVLPPSWDAYKKQLMIRITNTTDETLARQVMASRSPMNFVNQISKALLITQGANDVRVKKSESDQMVKALKAKGNRVMYVVFPDEGHGYDRNENWIAAEAFSEQFLQVCLGGAAEPYATDITRSSAQVIEP